MKLNSSILLPPKKFTAETSVEVLYAYNLSSGSSYITQYIIKDHLGSTRAVVDASGSLLQSTDYYAFGLPFSTTNTDKNRYLYNGKEIENNTIGGTQLATLDYGARHYDPIIARWFTTDPMAEKYYSLTPYNYCGNNPMRFVDPDGKDYGIKFNKKNKTITVSAVYYTNSQSKASLSRAIKVFNNRTEDKFIYKNEEYSIIYNLSEKVYADPVEHVKLYDKKKGHDDYNSYVISKPDSNNRKGYITTGSTKDHRQIKVSENYKDNPTTGAHEIGHTLNFDHTDKGLMTPTNSDELRDKNPTQENINNMIDKKLTKGILESLINLFKKNEK